MLGRQSLRFRAKEPSLPECCYATCRRDQHSRTAPCRGERMLGEQVVSTCRRRAGIPVGNGGMCDCG